MKCERSELEKFEIELLRVNMLYLNGSEASRKFFPIELSRAKQAGNFLKILHFSPKF